MKHPIRSLTLAAFLLTSALHAQVPQLVNYQGRVAVGAVNFNGSGQFKFALVNTAGTTTYWSNDGSSVGGAQPTAGVALAVTKGLYSVLLGDTSLGATMTAIPATVWTNADVRLRVWFNDGTSGSQLLTPDQRLAPSGYLADGSVSGTALATGAVTSGKLAANAVQASNLADGAITSAKIASGAVGSAQLGSNLTFSGATSGLFTGSFSGNGTGISFGTGGDLNGDQGGSIELGNSLQAGAIPFIDFHYGTGSVEDYNVRLINDGVGRLTLVGDLAVSGAVSATGISLGNGVIQRGGPPLTALTADLGLYSQVSGNYMRFVTNAAPFHWFSDSGIGTTPSMSLTAAGNLGIGTSAPGAKLHVNGGGTGVGVFAGDLAPFGQAPFMTNLSTSTTHIWSAENGTRVFSVTGGGDGYFAGNVGIGTAAPQARLHVAGNLKLDGDYFSSAGRLHIQSGERLYLNPFAGDTLVGFGSGPGNLYVGGNVGIGTTAPGARLDVNGGIDVNGANVIELGAGVAGKDPNAGTIGYQSFTAGALDIVGAGTTGTNRKLKLWAEGGTTFTGSASIGGAITAASASFSGAISAPSATIPTLNGNISVGGALSATSVTFPTLNGNVSVGGTLSASGAISAPSATIPTLNGNVSVGGTITAPFATIPRLNGNVIVGGEITATVVTVTGGSDVAEPYEVASAGAIQPVPGMVVAIDREHIGQMRVAAHAYDKTVAGILSGANGIAPGITLRQKGTVADGSLPVASIGRVWCWCDADANGPIDAGDMLTTSDTPGHAMRVDDHNAANGAVIGKAMSPLKSGRGMVLVLVSLK